MLLSDAMRMLAHLCGRIHFVRARMQVSKRHVPHSCTFLEQLAYSMTACLVFHFVSCKFDCGLRTCHAAGLGTGLTGTKCMRSSQTTAGATRDCGHVVNPQTQFSLHRTPHVCSLLPTHGISAHFVIVEDRQTALQRSAVISLLHHDYT